MVDDGRRTTDGRTPDHGHPISSPCEPDGSGELIKPLREDFFCFSNCKSMWFNVSTLFKRLVGGYTCYYGA